MSRAKESSFQFLMALPTQLAAEVDAIASETGAPRVAVVRSAIEVFLTARRGQKVTVVLSDKVHLDFAALAKAMYGASPQEMIDEAIEDFVQKQLRHNEGIREKFNKALAEIKAKGEGANARIIEFDQSRVS